MKIDLYPLFSYIRYWLLQEDRYALQAPFVYQVYNNLLSYLITQKSNDLDLEALRKLLLKDQEILKISDYGAGSKKLVSQFRKTAEVTKYSTTGRKYSQLYQYFCSLTPAEKVLELGTCLGINSRYLSRATVGTLYTLEGAHTLYQKAQESKVQPNTKYILGNIKDTLPDILIQIIKVDFVLIDATHTHAGTISYYNQILPFLHKGSIIAIADIHWSKEMNQAWQEIIARPEVRLSLDFYECGIIFFDEEIAKKKYILKI